MTDLRGMYEERPSRWARLRAWYGYGPEPAEAVARPRLWLMVVAYPLLPYLLFRRLEVRDGRLTKHGAVVRRGGTPPSVTLAAGTRVRVEGGLGSNRYRQLVVEHEDEQVRFALSFWRRWRDIDRAIAAHVPDHEPMETFFGPLTEPRWRS